MFIFTTYHTDAFPTYITEIEGGGYTYQAEDFTFVESPDEFCFQETGVNSNLISGYDEGFFYARSQTRYGYEECGNQNAGNTIFETEEWDLDIYGAGDVTGYTTNFASHISVGDNDSNQGNSGGNLFVSININIDSNGTTSIYTQSAYSSLYGEAGMNLNGEDPSFTNTFEDGDETSGQTFESHVNQITVDETVYSADCAASEYIPIDSEEQGLETWLQFTQRNNNGDETTYSQDPHQTINGFGIPFAYPIPFTDTDISLIGVQTSEQTTGVRFFTGYRKFNVNDSFNSSYSFAAISDQGYDYVCREVFILNTDPFYVISPVPRVPMFIDTIFNFNQLTTQDEEIVWIVTAEDGDEGMITDLADSYDEDFTLYGSDYYEMDVQEPESFTYQNLSNITQGEEDFTNTNAALTISDFAQTANQFSLPGGAAVADALNNPYDSDASMNSYTFSFVTTIENTIAIQTSEYGDIQTETSIGFAWVETSIIFLTALNDANELSVYSGGFPKPERRHTTEIFNNSYLKLDTATYLIANFPDVDPDQWFLPGPFSREDDTVFEDGMTVNANSSFAMTRTIFKPSLRNGVLYGRQKYEQIYSPMLTGGIAPFDLTGVGAISDNRDIYCDINAQIQGEIAGVLQGQTNLNSLYSLASIASAQQIFGLQGGISSLMLGEHSLFHDYGSMNHFFSAFDDKLTYEVIDSNHGGATLEGSVRTTTDTGNGQEDTLLTGNIFIQLGFLRNLAEVSGLTNNTPSPFFVGFLHPAKIYGGNQGGFTDPQTIYNMADWVVRFITSNWGGESSYTYSTLLSEDRLDEVGTDVIVGEVTGKYPYISLFTNGFFFNNPIYMIENKFLTVGLDYNEMGGRLFEFTEPSLFYPYVPLGVSII